jgi:hypothetical protein
MKKLIRNVVLVVVLIVVIGVVIVWFSLNSIVRSTIQTQATASLNVPTTLDAVDLKPFAGSVGLTGLDVGSPPNYTAPHMFVMDGLNVSVSYGQLFGNPIHVKKIVIDNPELVVEQSGGKLNLQVVMSGSSSSSSSGGGGASSSQSSSQMKFIIDELDVNNAKVTILPGVPGLSQQQEVTVPSLVLKNIGNADNSENGAAIKDVIMQVCTALATQAGQSAGLSQLTGQLGQLGSQFGQSFQQQMQSTLGQLGGGSNNNGAQGLLNGLLGSKKSQ